MEQIIGSDVIGFRACFRKHEHVVAYMRTEATNTVLDGWLVLAADPITSIC